MSVPMDTAVMFSSRSDEWETPDDLFRTLDSRYHFTLDVCATAQNAKCPRYFTREQDGLAQEWRGVCWMNPPYGRQIGVWVKKAYETAQCGNGTVICLLPSRTDTRWWHDYCMKGEIVFIKGRLRFCGSKNPAPFPSAVVIFKHIRNADNF